MSLLSDVSLRVERLTPSLGARVTGVDVSRPLDQETVDALRNLLLTHKLLVFPQQDLDADTQVAFAQRFGELTANHPVTPPLDADHPQVWQIETRRASPAPSGPQARERRRGAGPGSPR